MLRSWSRLEVVVEGRQKKDRGYREKRGKAWEGGSLAASPVRPGTDDPATTGVVVAQIV